MQNPRNVRPGDGGWTRNLRGDTIRKSAPELEACGAIDEVNSLVGWACRVCSPPLQAKLRSIQQSLQHAASVAAGAEVDAHQLEEAIGILDCWNDGMESSLPPLTQFILPGGNEAAARLHVARSACRRAERSLVNYYQPEQDAVVPIIAVFNRLSSFLFTAARSENGQT